jgi:hypothetical protein
MDIRHMGALIRYYLHEDPDTLDDDQFCERWCELSYALRWDGKVKVE